CQHTQERGDVGAHEVSLDRNACLREANLARGDVARLDHHRAAGPAGDRQSLVHVVGHSDGLGLAVVVRAVPGTSGSTSTTFVGCATGTAVTRATAGSACITTVATTDVATVATSTTGVRILLVVADLAG